MGWRRWFTSEPRRRDRGAPPSGNGASSLHLGWQLPPVGEPVVECAVDFELLDEPANRRLIFWALQASFSDGRRSFGGAHFGFQWHPNHPSRRVVCWGGYADAGGELSGDTPFPGSLDGNGNICHFPWTTGERWRWRIRATPDRPGWWRGEIVAPGGGEPIPIRDLHGGGRYLTDLMVWSEVFAHCDDPSVRVRWTSMTATLESGRIVSPTALSVNYQSYEDGGCTNTNSFLDGYGAVQQTSTERATAQGSLLYLA